MKTDFDVIIIGGGIAGSTTAIQLSETKLNILLIEKEEFPRNKICGGALSVDTVHQLRKLKLNTFEEFENFDDKNLIESFGISYQNNHKDFSLKKLKEKCYVINRNSFDNFLFEKVKSLKNIEVKENEKVLDFMLHEDKISVISNKNSYSAKIIVGADGAYSVTARKLAKIMPKSNHYLLAAQCYFSNVKFEHQNKVELHFCKDILPGYLWIFPSTNNLTNIGIGMKAKDITKNKIDLKKQLIEKINSKFNDRFLNAE